MTERKQWWGWGVGVGDLLTVNDREKAVVGVGRGNPKLTISCIRKGERTFMPSGNTRLLGSQPPGLETG